MIMVLITYIIDIRFNRFTMARQNLTGNTGTTRARRDPDAVWQMVEKSWWHVYTKWKRQGEQSKCLGSGQHWWSVCCIALWSGCSSHCCHFWILLQFQTQHSGWNGMYQFTDFFTYFLCGIHSVILLASKKNKWNAYVLAFCLHLAVFCTCSYILHRHKL